MASLEAPIDAVSDAWVIVDLETTGLSPAGDAIVEIGAVRLQGPYLNGEFHSLVDPGRPIPFQAQRVHGISDAMVAGAPTFAEVLPRFLRFAEGAVLISHNARFDRGFLDAGCARATGGPLPHRHLDTLRLARRLLPRLGRHGLDSLVQHLGVRRFDGGAPEAGPAREGTASMRHRALGDAMATAEVWLHLQQIARIRNLSLDGCFVN